MIRAAWRANYSGFGFGSTSVKKILCLIDGIGDRVTVTDATAIKICYVLSRSFHVRVSCRIIIDTMNKVKDIISCKVKKRIARQKGSGERQKMKLTKIKKDKNS
jgi:hypothetical protein